MQKVTHTTSGKIRTIKTIIGKLPISEKQRIRLNINCYQRNSLYLEKCCVRASANVSYENASRDIQEYMGIKISAKTQQRIVHRHDFSHLQSSEYNTTMEEISIDGGKVRLRTPKKEESCIWRDYKAICVNKEQRYAWFNENHKLINYVNEQPDTQQLFCIGDGHPGIWKLVKQFDNCASKQEILDWFHLMENLNKIKGSLKRRKRAESLLWEGKVDQTMELISGSKKKQAENFVNYLRNHRHRIINYRYYQEEQISSIGSGAVESTVKQIDRRVKISGAQWKEENVPQVLKQRCAYLNNQI